MGLRATCLYVGGSRRDGSGAGARAAISALSAVLDPAITLVVQVANRGSARGSTKARVGLELALLVVGPARASVEQAFAALTEAFGGTRPVVGVEALSATAARRTWRFGAGHQQVPLVPVAV